MPLSYRLRRLRRSQIRGHPGTCRRAAGKPGL